MTSTLVSSATELKLGLQRAGVSDVDDSPLARALYSSDASLYRVAPLAVVRPRNADEVLSTLAVCRELGIPLTSRGAGTSIAGNAIGPGVVLDFSKYMNVIHDVNPESRTARVDPGVVLSSLQQAGAPHGLRTRPARVPARPR